LIWYILNYQSIEKRGTEKFCGDPKFVLRVLEGVLEKWGLNE
jgi:hypothetical protein